MLDKVRRIPKYIHFKYYSILNKYQLYRRRKYLGPIKSKLTNHSMSVFSNNCVGGVLLHELGLRFNSPFVNLFIIPHDYVELLSKPDYYFNKPLIFSKEESVNYPVAYIDSIRISFVHYKTTEEAEKKWIERIKRINWKNLFVIMTEQDGCSHGDLIRFDHLPYENKVAFTKEKYPDVKNCCLAEGYEGKAEVSKLLDFHNRYSIHRNYDFFDFVSWFNHNSTMQK